MYKRCILLAVLLAFYSLAGHSQTTKELTKRYNDCFYSQKYPEALDIIEKLLETSPQNLDYRREKIKMQSILGKEEAFFQNMIELRNASITGNIKCFFSILSSEMVNKEFSKTLHTYFKRKNDEYILTKWDLKLSDKAISNNHSSEQLPKEKKSPKKTKKEEEENIPKTSAEASIQPSKSISSGSAKL
jgi:hypothetical protein